MQVSGSRRNTRGYSQLRSHVQYVQSLHIPVGGTGEVQSQPTTPGSMSGSIALESFVKNEQHDIERDGHVTSKYEADDITDSFVEEFVSVTHDDAEEAQAIEFQRLLAKESSCRRSCCHKGLLSNTIFLSVMIIGIVLIEIYFVEEGPRGFSKAIVNDTTCKQKLALCFTFRVIRSIGVFGFFGGIVNWLFIELLFRKIFCLYGSGVIMNYYDDIISGLRSIVLDILFDSSKLKEFFSGKNKKIQTMLQLDQQFEALLKSEATQIVINKKIAELISSPQGYILVNMGVNIDQLKNVIKNHVDSFIKDISKTINERLRVPGITDGGLKSEIISILEPRLVRLNPTEVNKIVAVMLRKHLSWLIIWGNLFGGLLGLLSEVVLIIIVRSTHNV